MLRVREASATKFSSPLDGCGSPRAANPPPYPKRHHTRLAAYAALGLSLGATVSLLAISYVQAGDDAGVRAFHQQEAENRARRASAPAQYTSTASSYAPVRQSWILPLFRTNAAGEVEQPAVELNPFKPREAKAKPKKLKSLQSANVDTVSGAADVARTICVRLCDGFQAPLGYLRANADMKSHQALCEAQNPGIPVKVFRVAAGATSIDGAVAADGKTYGSLPVAFSHERSADPACRPAIVKAGERRVSLLRDFTLRAGDSVVLNGRVQTFSGSQNWPYSLRDFRDFRSSPELSANDRRKIDGIVGVSKTERDRRAFQRALRVKEASLHDPAIAADVTVLRGNLDDNARASGTVRIIAGTSHPMSR